MSRSSFFWRASLLLIIGAISTSVAAQQALLTEWVEANPFNEQDKISLGYPVPIPVDSPLPFDGFRSYQALNMRHQDLAVSTDWVHPEDIGKTRSGRTIRAYRLGDKDKLTPWGLPEQATLTNGGIHAREWQSPEVVTGILELIATTPSDQHLYDFLREQVNMVVIPVLNIDGFLQTQRYPSLNYLKTDISDPDNSPRDGRMRRKNMQGVDEDLGSLNDHLHGIDLNRNNAPYWASSTSSSNDQRSLIYHGTGSASEPETRALDAAAQLGPASRLSLYTDVHSYSQVHFWARNNNESLALQTQTVLNLFSRHHNAFPAGKYYLFSDRSQLARNSGIGSTDEYFTNQYQVPAWTLEVEPTGGQPGHGLAPGTGADYGGDGVNGHDGFILPEREIRRVREQLAQSFAAAFYRQSGPPHAQVIRIFDEETSALVYESSWDVSSDTERSQFVNALRNLELERSYRLWIAFSKPMRWLENGDIAPLPGQFSITNSIAMDLQVNGQSLEFEQGDFHFPLAAGGAPAGYLRYATDTATTTFTIKNTAANGILLEDSDQLELGIRALDMTGTLGLDSNPSSVASWNARWQGYEGTDGNATEFGGWDRSATLTLSAEQQPDSFLPEKGMSAAWYDPERASEGLIIEMLASDKAAMYWFTYDKEGGQDWYLGLGEVRGNRLVFSELIHTRGGRFRPGAQAPELVEDVAGTASITFSDCDHGQFEWHIGNQQGRQALQRLTRLMGLECGFPLGAPTVGPIKPQNSAPISEDARLSGAWFDPARHGQGMALQMLRNGTAAVHWFSYDRKGAHRWFFGVGSKINGVWEFPELLTSSGGLFADQHTQGDPQLSAWGSLTLELGPDGGTARHVGTEEGFGVGRMELSRLTRLLEDANSQDAVDKTARNMSMH